MLLWSFIEIAKIKLKKLTKKKLKKNHLKNSNPHPPKKWVNCKLQVKFFNRKSFGELENVMTVIIKCQSNSVSYLQIISTNKTKNFNLKIVVKNSKTTTPPKWVNSLNCELNI